jgi:hypothetical protein
MSITFIISGDRANFDADACPACANGEWQTCLSCDGSGFSEAYRTGTTTAPNYVNVSEANAPDLLRWLGFEVDGRDMCGVIAPADLRARCERRLDASRFENVTDDLPKGAFSDCRFYSGGRSMGYLAARTRDLLALATLAGDRAVVYS